MSRRRGASGLCGVLALDKPYGMTSHDVVNRVRQITGERRVGHAGTLDPAATGLMLVGVGAATRLSEYLTGHDKGYDARIVFGVATDTDDAQGRTLASASDGELADIMRSVDAQAILDEFTGELEQLPPAYSAIKKNGIVAYKAAREGTCLELEARHVTVYGAQLAGAGVCEAELICADGNTSVRELPFWDVHFDVSKGTYIRALARDIGAYLGCGAHLGSLRRTSVAAMGIDEACSIDELANRAEAGDMLPWCDPARLLGFPVIELGEQQAQCVANGRELTDISAGEGMVSCIRDNKLLAVYNFVAGACRPATVIPGGVIGVG